MCGDEYARMVIKQGTGVPTIPASADHRNGDWLATDIYEGEFYQDTATGVIYTRNGSNITMANGVKSYNALISQSGTSAPTATVLSNALSGTPSFAYTSPGIYTLTLTGEFITAKTFIHMQTGVKEGFVKAYRTSDDVITIKSYNDSITLSNVVLDQTAITIEVYP